MTKGRLALSTETAQMLNHIDPFTPPHRRFVSTHRQAHSLNHKLLCPGRPRTQDTEVRGEGNEGGEGLSPFTRLLLMGGCILSPLWFSTLERSTHPPFPADRFQHPGQIQAPRRSSTLDRAGHAPIPSVAHAVTPTQTDTADLLWTSPSHLQLCNI